jgi:putative transposase
MIEQIQAQTGAGGRTICRVLRLPRSSHYHAAEPTSHGLEDRRLGDLVETVFREHQRRYGHRRIAEELRQRGHVCSVQRVRRLMKARGLQALTTRRFVPQTSDGKAAAPSPNLLKDRSLPTRPNEVWAGDITYLPSRQGWLYLAVVLDLHSRRIVGWHLGTDLRAGLVCEALRQALVTRGTRQAGLIFHSDRGSQYSSRAYRQQLAEAGIAQSMSSRGNPYHNAWTESCIGTLKTELVQNAIFEDHADAQRALFSYIESYYNPRRLHSALSYRSPNQAEREHPPQAA